MEQSDGQQTHTTIVDGPDHEEECGGQMTFDPPVYIQRYNAIRDILCEEHWLSRISKVS